jgi:integrase
VRRRIYRGEVDLPKSGRAREIVLFPEARDALLGLPRDGDRIFRAKRGGDLTASTIAYYWQAITAVFGPVDPHELRHFAGHHLYVTMGLRRGWSRRSSATHRAWSRTSTATATLARWRRSTGRSATTQCRCGRWWASEPDTSQIPRPPDAALRSHVATVAPIGMTV